MCTSSLIHKALVQKLVFYLHRYSILLVVLTYAQVTVCQINSFHDRINTPSPNAASLAKMIDYPVSYFTGLPQIDIPIYELKTRDITVPIKLSYHASGFKPDEYPSWVGVNWALMAGGCITRKVNGFPDEDNNGGYIECITLDDPSLGREDEYPDEYYFNVLGYSGKFYLESILYGSAYAVSSPGVRIRSLGLYKEKVLDNSKGNCFINAYCRSVLEEYIADPYGIPCIDSSKHIAGFRVILPNGLVCDFGRKMEDLPNVAPIVDKSVSRPVNACIAYTYDTWHLVRIYSPESNSEITFTYSTNNGEHIAAVSRQYAVRIFPAIGDVSGSCPAPPYITKGITYSSNVTFPRYLIGIHADNANISFISGESTQLDYGSGLINDICSTTLNLNSPNNGRQLNSIEVKNKTGNLIWKYNFNYLSNSTKRLRLLSINENNRCKYQFSYNNFDNEPSYNTGTTDFWGFYCPTPRHDDVLSIINSLFDGIPNPSSDTLSAVSESFISSLLGGTINYGMLTRITYQTGGYTDFSYEKNTFDFYNNRNDSAKWELISNNNVYNNGPGLRIKSIKHYDSDSTLQLHKDYYYDWGILSGLPKLFWEEVFYYPKSDVRDTIKQLFLKPPLPMSSNGSSVPITYSKVTEKDNNGSTVYYYRNYKDHEDIWEELYTQNEIEQLKYLHLDDDSVSYEIIIGGGIISGCPNALGINSRELERGQLIFKIVYNENEDTLLKEKYFYDVNDNAAMPLTINNATCYMYSRGYVIEPEPTVYFPKNYVIRSEFEKAIYPFNLYKKESFYYPDADSAMYTMNAYEYDAYNNVNREVQILGNGDSLITRKAYVHEFEQTTPSYALDKVVLEKNIRLKNAGKYLTEAKYFEYYEPEDSILILNKARLKEISSPILNDTAVIVGEDIENYYQILNVTAYDNNYNPLEAIDIEGMTTSYMWDHTNTHLIATVKNAKHNEIYYSGFENNTSSSFWAKDSLDSSNQKTGNYALRIRKPTAGESYMYSPFLDIDNTITKKYKYSVWVYSDTPGVDFYFFMKTENNGQYSGYSNPPSCVSTIEANKWIYLEGEVSVPANMKCLYLRVDNNGGGNVWYDDIRLYPSEAEMTSYTHTLLRGMTSQTDTNGQTIFYEYDNMNRLICIRDHNMHIIKTYNYNYAASGN